MNTPGNVPTTAADGRAADSACQAKSVPVDAGTPGGATAVEGNRATEERTNPERCPAITTHEPRRVRQRPHLLPDELLGHRHFRTMVLRDNFPIPGDDFREGYCLGRDISYWLQGLADFLRVMQQVERFGVTVNTVLDFGCASGRVARHFSRQLNDVVVWASEINPRHIEWLRKHGPGNIRPIQGDGQPGLPIADDSIDLACAFSVFTHLDSTEIGWLEEMRRVLRPGGICYFTVHNEDTWSALAELDPSNRLVRSMVDTGEFQLHQLSQPMPRDRLVYNFQEDGPYRCQVFHSNRYLREVWSQYLDILDILPCEHHRQSVVVMQKPDAIR